MNQNRFEQLEVWQKAHQYVLAVYQTTKSFPSEEKYALTDQLRRSSASVATNIVEGNERRSTKKYLQFLYTAKASLAESQYQLLLAKDLGYLKLDAYKHLHQLSHEVAKLLICLIKYIKSSS